MVLRGLRAKEEWIERPLSIKGVKNLLRSGSEREVWLRDLSILGECEHTLLRNLLILMIGDVTVRVARPRLTLRRNKQSVKLLAAIVEAVQQSASRRRNISRLVTALIHHVPVGRPSKATQEIFERVFILHEQKKSVRAISKELGGVSRSTVARILKLHARHKQVSSMKQE